MTTRITSTFGQPREFDPSEDNWKSYSERLDFYLDANNVADVQKKRSVLWAFYVQTHSQSLFTKFSSSPNFLVDKTYKEEVIELFSNHYRLTASIVVECLRFHSTVNQSNESVSTFILERLFLHAQRSSCMQEY